MIKYWLAPLSIALLLPVSRGDEPGSATQESTPGSQPKKELKFVEENVGDMKLPGGEVKGLRVGKKIEFDQAWATEHQAPLDRPFEVIVPKGQRIFVSFHDKSKGRPELANIQFATEDKQLAENIRLTPINVPAEPPMDERLHILASLLMRDGVKMATAGWPKSAAKQIYKTKVGDYDAVVVHGFMQDPERGEYFFKLTGILQKGENEGLMAFAMIDPKLSDVKTPADLGSKGQALKVLHSIRFTEDSGEES